MKIAILFAVLMSMSGCGECPCGPHAPQFEPTPVEAEGPTQVINLDGTPYVEK